MTLPVAVASSSQLAADAGAAVAELGGNAVDTAIAAVLASMNTEPGVCGLGGGGFVTVWRTGEPATVIDGYAAAPGMGLPRERLGAGGVEVRIDYGGGVRTIIGPGAVAVPGSVAALGEASARFGALPWATLFEPVIAAVEKGFPLPRACHQYLVVSADCVFGQDPSGWGCLHDEVGRLKKPGDTIHIPHLADSLRRVAQHGAREFYSGELGRSIADHVQALGGSLTREDLSRYRARYRTPMITELGGWQVATNPSPAIGGVVLTAMLSLMAGDCPGLPEEPTARQIAVQKLVLGYRCRQLGHSTEIERDLARMMNSVTQRDLAFLESPSTVQTSAMDGAGLACSITMSTGYGSGLMPAGTGIWLNNCLGEVELIPTAPAGPAPGVRLPSNMAPTVARDDRGNALAIGSPGADRITTALLQVLDQFLLRGKCLTEAIGAPRLHVEYIDDSPRLAHEPVGDLPADAPSPRPFGSHSMYFGGVAAAALDTAGELQAAADPRRASGTRIVNSQRACRRPSP